MDGLNNFQTALAAGDYALWLNYTRKFYRFFSAFSELEQIVPPTGAQMDSTIMPRSGAQTYPGIDSWGRGIEKITDACKQAGLPEPVIEENSGGVAVELLKSEVKTPVETRVKTPVEMRVKTPEAILQVLKQDASLTLAEVADHIGKSVSAVERAAKKLSDQGKLKYVGPQKGGHWEVKE